MRIVRVHGSWWSRESESLNSLVTSTFLLVLPRRVKATQNQTQKQKQTQTQTHSSRPWFKVLWWRKHLGIKCVSVFKTLKMADIFSPIVSRNCLCSNRRCNLNPLCMGQKIAWTSLTSLVHPTELKLPSNCKYLLRRFLSKSKPIKGTERMIFVNMKHRNP